MRFKRSHLLLSLTLLSSNLMGFPTWTGTNSSDWTDPGNWTGGVPMTGDTPDFPAGLLSFRFNLNYTNIVGTSPPFNGLTIATVGTSYVIDSLNPANALAFNSAATITTSGVLPITIGGHLSAQVPLNVSVGVATTINAVIQNDSPFTGSLSTSGASNLILTGTNTYTGGTTVTGNILEISADVNLGAANTSLALNAGSNLQIDGGSFSLTNRPVSIGVGTATVNTQANNFTIPGAISGSGSLKKTGTGILILPNANVGYTGPILLDQGALNVGNNNSLGTNSVTYQTNAGNTVRATGSITIPNTLIFNANGNIDSQGFVFSVGNLSGASQMTKVGAGTLVLPNANSPGFTGPIHLDLGTISVGNNTSLGSGTLTFETNQNTLQAAGSVAINNNLVINFNSNIDTNLNSFTLNGAISGAQKIFIIGAGFLFLPNSNAGYTGNVGIDNAVVVISNAHSFGSGTVFFENIDGNAIISTANIAIPNTLQFNNAGDIQTQPGTALSVPVISGTKNLSKFDTGTLSLPNANGGYSGNIFINEGILSIGNNGSLGTGFVSFVANPNTGTLKATT